MKTKYLLLLSLFLTSHNSLADAYFKYGLSVGQPDMPSSKLFSVGRQYVLPRGFLFQLDGGVVNTPGYSTKLAALVSASFGVEVVANSALRLQGLWGPSYYSRRDGHLGGPFQFSHDLCADAMDRNNFIGVCYKHVSSAGIHSPNKGIDAVQLRLGIRF